MRDNRHLWTLAVAIVVFLVGAGLFVRDSAARASRAEATAKAGRGGTVWGADYFPNTELIAHTGERLRFFDDMIAGKVVALNFIYTSCPDACPMETARMKEVYELLDGRVGDDVHFYSISIDPERDTPEVLAGYVEQWEIPPGWTFLTGREADIVHLRRKLGLYIEDIQAEDSYDHNLSLLIGNQSTGRWMKRSPFENPYILASEIGGELHNWKLPRPTDRPYDQAPELRNISKGESLYRTRCKACHTVGGGDVLELAQRRVGPDLLNVVGIRDPAWLRRWISEPDVMLTEGDPLAVALRDKYNGVAMPNMRLSGVEVEMILEYLEEESARVLAAGSSRAENPHRNHEPGSDHGAHAAAMGSR